MACNALCTATITFKNTIYESIHCIQQVRQASFSFLALGAGMVISIALSSSACRSAENLKNLAISPMNNSALLKNCMLQATTTAKFS